MHAMSNRYDLKSVKMPKLKGRALAAYGSLAHTAFPGGLLRHKLLADGGLLRARTEPVAEPPTFTPRGPAPAASTESAAAPAPALDAIHAPRPTSSPYASALDYAKAFREGRTTPLAVAEAVLEAVDASEALSPPMRGWIALDRDDVRSQAAAATERYKRGAPLGPLDGVPATVKDEFDQVPYPSTAGTSFLGALRKPKADATIVARLRAAGVVLVGKTNMHEIGIDPSGLNAHHGQARNPFDPRCDTGGSSSGSAAAVGAGIVPFALGADGGGSIRVPAALCGVVGLKPTFGRVSEAGAVPLCSSVGHAGPIGSCVEDVALAYAVIAGPDPLDANTSGQPAVSVDGAGAADLRGVRLGVYQAWFEHADPQVVQANRRMLEALGKAGAEVREVEVPDLDLMRVAHAITILTEMEAFVAATPDRRHLLGDSVKLTLEATREMRSSDYVWAQRVRTRALANFAKIYSEVDALVTPTTGIVAPVIPEVARGQAWTDLGSTIEVMRFVVPGNFCGLPAISFPVGHEQGGLPIAMQAMAAHWNEALLLRIARVAELNCERRAPARFWCPLDKAAAKRG
ncbi:MAG: amidase [Myxococcales bacterium]